jgi:hypothetical protein
VDPKTDITIKIIYKREPPRNRKHLPEYKTQIFLSNHLKGGGGEPDNYTKLHQVQEGLGVISFARWCYSDKILLDDYATKVSKFISLF